MDVRFSREHFSFILSNQHTSHAACGFLLQQLHLFLHLSSPSTGVHVTPGNDYERREQVICRWFVLRVAVRQKSMIVLNSEKNTARLEETACWLSGQIRSVLCYNGNVYNRKNIEFFHFSFIFCSETVIFPCMKMPKLHCTE